MKYALRGLCTRVGVGLGLIMSLCAAYAEGASSETESLSELTAQWWQWAISIPTTVNPIADISGANCMVGQRGSVWFLAGSFSGGTTVVRTCSVPDTAKLFFPVVNFVNINTPNVCGQNSVNQSAKFLRSQIVGLVDGAVNLSVTVDSQPVEALQRVKSIVFDVAMPLDNIFNAGCGGPGSVPAGVYSPAVDDGFYVHLQPLEVGNHTLHIHGEIPGVTVQDVTYKLTVVEVLRE